MKNNPEALEGVIPGFENVEGNYMKRIMEEKVKRIN